MEEKFNCILELYEKKYEFKQCEVSEIDNVIRFLKEYWNENHILVRSPEIMKWQYYDKIKDKYNFIIAIDKKTTEIHGLLGFIMTSQFDESISTPMRWGAIWKVRDDVAKKGLGIALKLYMYKNIPAPYAGGIGLSKYSKVINTKMNEEVGKLQVYYMINENIQNYRLIDNVTEEDIATCTSKSKKKFIECNEIKFLNYGVYFDKLLSYKSPLYYINRYFKHPIYKYKCIQVIDENDICSACFFIRICSANDSKCIMIVDFIGDEYALVGATNNFKELLRKYEAEYIMFYEYGLDDKALNQSGLKLRGTTDIVLPVYYEPFSKVNIDIDYHYFNLPSVPRQLYFFKADADQDRPNRL